jgi:PAS domain S-box-containing protein
MHYDFPGRVFDVEISVNPIRSADGTVTGASFFSKNITKRKQSEATLRFHANVLAQVDDAVIGMDNERRITYWNTGAQSLYQLTAHEAMGKNIDEVYGTEWIQPEDEQLAQDTLRSTGSCRMEVLHVLRDGRRIYVDTNTHVWRDENGQAIGLLAVTRDITRSKQAEATSHKTSQTLTSLLENSQNIIFAVDREYRYIAFNHQHKDAIKQLYNIDIQPGMSLEEFTRGASEDRNKMFSLLDRALSGEQFIITEPFGNPNLVRRHFEHAFTPMLDAAGRVVGVTVFSLDITERIESQEELKRINFELDSFVYRSSHDMRAPLRSILGLVSLIREEHNSAQQVYYLELMEKSVQKLDTFITDMTDFSRNSRLEVAVAPIDFEAIIAGCADNLRYMENAERVALRVQVEASEPFYSDPLRISTVFQNLMSNSVKYQRLYIEDPYIEFAIRVDEQEVQIIYTDNGKGIDNEYLAKIFDMFFRASADSYGSGLGLYITDQVIKKMNGTIRVESELGQGSSFIITLPNLKTEAALKEPMML